MDPATLTMSLTASISSVTIMVGAVSSTAMTDVPLASFSKTYQLDASKTFTNDMYAKLDPVTLQVKEAVNTQKSIELSCSAGGVTSISYSLASYAGESPPSWVSLNSATSMMITDAPAVDVTTSYTFSVDSIYNSTTDQKPVTIQVVADCTIQG